MDFLAEIASRRRELVALLKARIPERALKAQAQRLPRPRSLARRLLYLRSRGLRPILAEYKRASPSRGIIAFDHEPEQRVGAYLEGGAAAISILTEPHYFLGTLEDLLLIRKRFPRAILLRKDFLVDPYQIWEARAYGADAVLLIVDLLGGELPRFLSECEKAGVEALVEIYREEELEVALRARARLVGINARNLRDLHTSHTHVKALLPLIPPSVIAVAESGIQSLPELLELEAHGARAFLIGETLMRAPNPAALLRAWVGREG